MSRNSGNYWSERAERVMRQGQKSADKVLARAKRQYKQAQKEIQFQIDKLYAHYAAEQGMNLADARAYLTGGELKEWRYALSEYVERINATGDQSLLRELNALSARSRIRRLEQVQAAIKVATSELASKGEELVNDLLGDVYSGTYKTVTSSIAKALGMEGMLEQLNARQVARAIAYPWSGADFSSRIWHNARQLSTALERTVVQGLVQGQDVRQMTDAIAKATGAAASDAERLIRTETARCIEESTLAGYKAAGVGQYQILVDEDERTCKYCGAINEAAVHDVAEAVTGVNLPPFHPRCRCTTVPYFTEEQLERWERMGAVTSDEPLANTGEDGILKEKQGEDTKVRTIARIDIEKYRVVSDKIRTDEVIITKERIAHIRERHPNDYERYAKYMTDIVEDPQYILVANKPNTAFVLKEFVEDDERFELILRLAVDGDKTGYKNSVITFLKIDSKRFQRYLRTKTILYKKE